MLHRLSKSHYTAGAQCHKLLWWKVREPLTADYKAQVIVYSAGAKAAGRDADVCLHFTRPNQVWSAG